MEDIVLNLVAVKSGERKDVDTRRRGSIEWERGALGKELDIAVGSCFGPQRVALASSTHSRERGLGFTMIVPCSTMYYKITTILEELIMSSKQDKYERYRKDDDRTRRRFRTRWERL